MKKRLLAFGLFIGIFSGCWTVRQPVAPNIPSVSLSKGREIHVQLAGFDAQVTKYVPAYGYATVTTFGGPYYCGPHHCCYDPGIGTAMVSSTEYLPQTEATAVYRDRATDALEHAGCILKTKDPQYRVEVRFEGPTSEKGDGWAAFGWAVCTLLTADYAAQDWTAKLRIHDLKTGKLVYEKDHLQRYETVVWGPIPLFSPLSSDRTSESVMQDWCLTVLTDVTVADALSFLATTK